jgi:hypothetical protein
VSRVSPAPAPPDTLLSPTGYRLWDESRRVALEIQQARPAAEGQVVLRFLRYREGQAGFDPVHEQAIERLLSAFVAWLEAPDGTLTQVVRLTQPRGAWLRDAGKWAVEYAPVNAPAGLSLADAG